MPCMCGDPMCWSCGPAQGYDLSDYETRCDRCGVQEWASNLTEQAWLVGAKRQYGEVCENCNYKIERAA